MSSSVRPSIGTPPPDPDLAAEAIAAKVVLGMGIWDDVSSISLWGLAARVREAARLGIEAHARYGTPLPTPAELEAAARPTEEELCEWAFRRRMRLWQAEMAAAAERAGIEVGPHPVYGTPSPLAVLKCVHAENIQVPA